eukprot:5967340-Pyramimonas_sp.AAC.1
MIGCSGFLDTSFESSQNLHFGAGPIFPIRTPDRTDQSNEMTLSFGMPPPNDSPISPGFPVIQPNPLNTLNDPLNTP